MGTAPRTGQKHRRGALSHSLDPGQRVGALREEWTGGLLRAGAPPPRDSTTCAVHGSAGRSAHEAAGLLPRNWPPSRATLSTVETEARAFWAKREETGLSREPCAVGAEREKRAVNSQETLGAI